MVLPLVSCKETTVEEGSTKVGVLPTKPADPFYPGAFVCEAFQKEDPVTDVFQGLVGQVFYLTQEQRNEIWRFQGVGDYLDEAVAIDQVSLYFNNIYIPTSWALGSCTCS